MGALPDHRQPGLDAIGSERRQVVLGPTAARAEPGQADDVRFTSRECQQAVAVAADDDRRPPRRTWPDRVAPHSIMRPLVVDRTSSQQGLHDGQRLPEPVDAHACGVEAETSFVIFAAHVTGSQAQLEPATAEQV